MIFNHFLKSGLFASTAGPAKKRDNRSAAAFSPLKKIASHFFNHAFGVTAEKEAANLVTGEKYNQSFNDSNSFSLPFIEGNSLYKLPIFGMLLQFLEGFCVFIFTKMFTE